MAVEDAWAALALGAMLCLGVSDLLNKRAMGAGVRRTQFLVVQSIFFTITTLALIPMMGGVEFDRELLYAVACGGITFVSYVFVLKALETGEATVAVPVYRMSFGVTVVLAVLVLGEALTARRVVGFSFIVVALVSLTALGDRRRERRPFHSHEGLPVADGAPSRPSALLAGLFAAVAMLTIGTKGLLYKVGVSEGASPATFALVQSLTFLPVAMLYARHVEGGLRIDRLTWSHAPYNGVLTALASVLLLMALVGGDASVVVPISQLCFVVTAVLAVLVLGERMNPVKVLGIASAVVAVLVLSTTLGPA